MSDIPSELLQNLRRLFDKLRFLTNPRLRWEEQLRRAFENDHWDEALQIYAEHTHTHTHTHTLGDRSKGTYCYPIGETEWRDVGLWTVILSVESCPGCFFNPGSQPTTQFIVIAEEIPEFPVPGLVLVIVLALSFLVVRRAKLRQRHLSNQDP